MNVRHLIALTAMTVAAALFSQTAAADIKPAWGVPTIIFDNSATTTGSPSITQDSSGNIHVLWYWYTNSGSAVGLLYAKRGPNGVWAPAEVVPASSLPGVPRSPTLLVDNNGPTAHVQD